MIRRPPRSTLFPSRRSSDLGTGEAIAVAGQTEIHTADIDAFRTAAGLSPKNLQLVSVDGTKGFKAGDEVEAEDRKSTRLNSSHSSISYAVFCLKKKKKTK